MGLVTTDVEQAAATLAAGRLCAIPTETVYGLAADAMNAEAILQVYEAKGRPADHPLIVHTATVADIDSWISALPDWARRLLSACAPGPLTVVGPRTGIVSDLVTGGQDTVAVRVPSHPITRQLLARCSALGVAGLVAPSANRFGHVSPTTAGHVVDDIGDYLSQHGGLVLDGGSCEVGVESTIVLATGAAPVVLRPGAVTIKQIEEATGLAVERAVSPPRVPGALDAHYAPRATVIVCDDTAHVPAGAGLIAYTEFATPPGVVRLASPTDADDFGRVLYHALRDGDRRGLAEVHVVAPRDGGIADAVNDRLRRAARTMGE